MKDTKLHIDSSQFTNSTIYRVPDGVIPLEDTLSSLRYFTSFGSVLRCTALHMRTTRTRTPSAHLARGERDAAR